MQDIGNVLSFSVRVLIPVCLTNLLLGTTIGVWLASKKTFASRFLETIVTLPLVFPPIAFGFFLIVLFGRQGFIGYGLFHIFNIDILFSQYGVFLASVIAGFPLMVKSVKTAAVTVDKDILEMGYIQGAGKGEIFLHIVLPNLKNGISTGLILSAGRSLGEVGMSLLLGGNIRGKTETISLAIFNAVFEGDIPRAALLSIILALLSIFFFTLIRQIEKEDNHVKSGSIF